ncbi:hypothetical protein TNCV_1363151 [Trichonephila clavipes]|nr:hypothetical protein TNCV_1363151 [Trichonephila clavipes]
MYNKILLCTAVLRPILTYGSPVWGYAADANIKILDVAQNSIIRNIVKADRYTKNSLIYKDIKKKGDFCNEPNGAFVSLQDDKASCEDCISRLWELKHQLYVIMYQQSRFAFLDDK